MGSHSQSKPIGNLFPIDQNSKTRIAGQLKEESGPCQDHIFLVLSQETLQPHRHRKDSLETKGEPCQGMFYPDTFSVKSILVKRCMCIHRRVLRYTKYGL